MTISDVMKMAENSIKGLKNTVGKGEIAVYVSPFSHSVF